MSSQSQGICCYILRHCKTNSTQSPQQHKSAICTAQKLMCRRLSVCVKVTLKLLVWTFSLFFLFDLIEFRIPLKGRTLWISADLRYILVSFFRRWRRFKYPIRWACMLNPMIWSFMFDWMMAINVFMNLIGEPWARNCNSWLFMECDTA